MVESNLTLTRDEADAICSALEFASEGFWPQFVSYCEARIDVTLLAKAASKLAEHASVDPPFDRDDF